MRQPIWTSDLERIETLCSDYEIEIVSYGLAPNPNGFCYEAEDVPSEVHEELSALLDSLSERETTELRRIVFG